MAKKRPSRKAPKVKIREEHPLQKVFLTDVNHPVSNFYDAQPGAWNLRRDNRQQLSWFATSPMTRIESTTLLELPLKALCEALLNLVVGLKQAFLIDTEKVFHRPNTHFGLIAHYKNALVAPNETRFAEAADNVYVAEGIPPGTALLFPNNPEDTGRLVEFPEGITHYGLTVWGPIQAVRIQSPKGFFEAPEIRCGR